MTAVLEAEVTRFEANMKAADAVLGAVQKTIDDTTSDAEQLTIALRSVQIGNAQIQQSIQNLLKLNTGLGATKMDAAALAKELDDIYINAKTVAENAVATKALENQLDDVRNAAIEAKVAMGDLGTEIIRIPGIKQFGPTWGNRRAFVAPPIGGPTAPQMQPTDYEGGAEIARLTADLVTLDRVISASSYQLSRVYPTYTPGMGPMTREQYLAQYATPVEGRRMVVIPETDYGDLRERYTFPPRGGNAETRRRDAAATAYLRSRGVDVGDVGGVQVFTRNQTHDALLAAALGLERGGPLSRGARFLGWGRGGGIHIPGFGVTGGGGGRGGLGLFGRNIFGGLAGFGTPLGLAGFGAERALFSSLGILGSFGGGILGGGVLGAGALGTMAVGAGTNLAGLGQAVGDIHTVSADLGKLNAAIQQYGKNSTQAADAQAQLNQDLKGFSPVARNSVLAAAQTSQAFRSMFDKLTGPAEKVGAQIANQAMQVGMKFLPTIATFAHQNMQILQSGLQPFFSWLQKGGNAQNIISDVNRLTQAQQQFGKHSIQATQANQQLIKDQRNVGGLGFFTDLEKVFQKNFPTAIHAGEQGFELLVKTIDLAAQHLGHFMASLDKFFTRMNNQDFGQWASGVEKLIGLFHSWLGMFVSFGRLIFDIFRPAVGLGKAFAELMSQVFKQIDKYVNQSGTQNILHNLFSVHLEQLIRGIGGVLMQLLPIVESIVSVFIQLETVAAKAATYILLVVKEILLGFNKANNALGGIPGKILAAGIAFRILQVANVAIFGGILKLLRAIPFIGILFGSAATEGQTAVEAVTASVDAAAASIVGAVGRAALAVRELAASFGLVGDAALTSAVEADAAMGTIGGAATAEAAVVGRSGLLAAGKGMLLRGGIYGALGYFGGQLIGKEVGGKRGAHYGSLIGLGAGIGTAIDPGIGTAVGAGVGVIAAFITAKGPSLANTLVKMSQAAQRFGQQAKLAAASGNALGAMQFRSLQNKQMDIMAATIEKVTKQAKEEAAATTHLTQTQIRDHIQAAKAMGASAQAIQNIRNHLNSLGNVTDITTQKLRQMASSLASSNPQLSLVLSTVARLNQQLGHMPSQKKITILIHEVFSASFKKGIANIGNAVSNAARAFLGLPPLTGGAGHHGATIHLTLPKRISDAIIAAQDGHGTIVAANKKAYEYYQRQLQQPGLTHAQRMKLYAAQSQYYSAIYGVPGGLPKGIHDPAAARAAARVPTGYLDKQQAETARARIEINKGQFVAALKLLKLEQAQLQAMLKTAKNQAERTRILDQLATVSSLIKSAKQQQTGISPGSYAIPIALQLAMAKADALAALNPNNTGPTSQQYKLAVQAKKAAMKAIDSHTLSMQQLIQAWGVVGQMNQIISQRLANKLAMYHKTSTDTVTDMVKGLTYAQEMQLRELMAQREAHRGYVPNQGYQSGPGSTPASRHHRVHSQPHTGRHHHPGVGAAAAGGTTIHIDTIEIHGVQNVRQLAAELERLARQKHQRAGGRR